MRFALLVLLFTAACATQRYDVDSPEVPQDPAVGSEEAADVPECPVKASAEGRAPYVPADRRVALAAPEEAAVVIHGRITDLRDEALPEDGIMVRLTIGERRTHTRTDPSGAFEFALPEPPDHATIWINPLPELRWLTEFSGYAVPLEPAQLDGTEGLEFQVARRVRGPVHGIVVDRETGNPLPYYRFKLSPSYKSERTDFEPVELVADAEGRFRTETEIFGGQVYARPPRGEPQVNGGSFDCIVQTATYDEPAVLRVVTGPTYELLLVGDAPLDPTQLSAFLVPEFETSKQGVPLRVDDDTGRVWVRLPAPRLRDGAGWFLAVTDQAGLLTGTTSVELDPKVPDEPLRILLEPTAAVRPKIMRAPSAATLAAGKRGFHPIGSVTKLEPADSVFVDSTTAWRLGRWKSLRPGDYQLRAWSREHAEATQPISLAAGEQARAQLELPLLPGLRTVRGEVRRADGAPVPSGRVFINLPGEVHRAWVIHYYTEPIFCGTGIDFWASAIEGTEGRVVRFELPCVPAGELEVQWLGGKWTQRGGPPLTVTRNTDAAGDLELSIVLDSRD